MRFFVCALMALTLVSCTKTPESSDNSNEQQAANDQPPILDLLKSGDITACAHPDVLSIFKDNSRVSFDEAQKELHLTKDQYDSVEPAELVLADISTTNVKRDVSEVECEANLSVSARKLGLVEYSARPAATQDGIVVSYNGLLGQAMAMSKLDHKRQLSMAVPKSQDAVAPPSQPSGASADSTSTDQLAAENPTSSYDKAKAALDQGNPPSGDH